MSTDQHTNSVKAKVRATRSQRVWGGIIFGIVGGGLLLLTILQRVGFDFGLLFWPCGFRIRTGYPCISCGMTRSVLAFSRGHLLEAFRLQPAAGLIGIVIIAAGVGGGWIALTGRMPHWVRQTFQELRLRTVLLLLVVILLAGWLVTLAQAWRALHPV